MGKLSTANRIEGHKYEIQCGITEHVNTEHKDLEQKEEQVECTHLKSMNG
jgi:hypothetical protein